MSKCTDQTLGNMLYEYELGLLDETDTDRLETHLLECTYCRLQALELRPVTELLREDGEIKGLFDELEQGSEPTVSGSPVVTPVRSKRRWSIWLRPAAVAAVLAVILVLKPWNIQIQPTEEAVAIDRVLMVMPFDNIADPADSSKLAAITTNLLATDLSESEYLRVVFPSQGTGRATWILTGDIVQTEPSLIVTARLTEVSSGKTVLSDRFGGRPEVDVFVLVDELGARVRNELLVPLGLDDQFDPAVASVTTGSALAYRHYLEGLEYLNQILREDARRSLERAVDIDSTFAMCYFYLARDFDPNLIVKAIKYSEGASRREQSHILALEAFFNGALGRADSIQQQIMALYPEDVLARDMLAMIARREGRLGDAIRYTQERLALDPSHRATYAYLAYMYAELGERETAVRTADAYVVLAPLEPNSYDTRADILVSCGYLDRAIADYEQVRALMPNFDDYNSMLELGRLYRYRGEYDKATACALEAASHASLSIRSMARTEQALVWMHQGKLEKGWRVLADGMGADRLEKAVPGGHGPGQMNHFVAGLVHLGTGEYDKAAEEFATTIEIANGFNPNDSVAYRALYALALAGSGEIKAAARIVKCLEDCRHQDERVAGAYWIGRGLVEFTQGDFRSAVASLEQVKEPFISESLSYQFWLARAYLENGMYAEAKDTFVKLLNDYSDPYRILMPLWAIQSHYYVGQAYEASGEADSALIQYQTFLDIWKDADPLLQPMVTDAQHRLSRLENRP